MKEEEKKHTANAIINWQRKLCHFQMQKHPFPSIQFNQFSFYGFNFYFDLCQYYFVCWSRTRNWKQDAVQMSATHLVWRYYIERGRWEEREESKRNGFVYKMVSRFTNSYLLDIVWWGNIRASELGERARQKIEKSSKKKRTMRGRTRADGECCCFFVVF